MTDKKKHGFRTTMSHVARRPKTEHGFVNPPLLRGSTVLVPRTVSTETSTRLAPAVETSTEEMSGAEEAVAAPISPVTVMAPRARMRVAFMKNSLDRSDGRAVTGEDAETRRI